MMQTWREIKNKFLETLSPMVGQGEATAIFKLTLEYFTSIYPPTQAVFNETVPREYLPELDIILNRLSNHEPIQYILGYAWFYDLKLKVDQNVLIPRQETEELVNWIIQTTNRRSRMRILDIGCGSGAIALALAKYTFESRVIAGDISLGAVNVAKENAALQQLNNVKFQQLDMLNLPTFQFKFDVIVSNPPYIDLSFRSKMPINVREQEPNIALFAPEGDELLFFKKIALFAKSHLNPTGYLFFEINEFYKDELVAELEKEKWQVESKKDMNGKWRMLRLSLE